MHLCSASWGPSILFSAEANTRKIPLHYPFPLLCGACGRQGGHGEPLGSASSAENPLQDLIQLKPSGEIRATSVCYVLRAALRLPDQPPFREPPPTHTHASDC